MHLDKLAGARLTGTMQAAYSLLCRLVRAIGWEATLLVRSGAFWMQDDYRSFAASIAADTEPAVSAANATSATSATSATTGSARVLSPLAHQVTTVVTAPSPSSSSSSSLASTHEVAAAAAAVTPGDAPHDVAPEVPAGKMIDTAAASLSSVALGTVGTPTLQSPTARPPRLLSSMSEDRESRRGQLQRHDSGVTVCA